MVENLAKNHEILITIEEGAIGGFGSLITQFLLNKGLLDRANFKFRSLFMADKFIEQNKIDVMQEEAGIGVESIINLVKTLL